MTTIDDCRPRFPLHQEQAGEHHSTRGHLPKQIWSELVNFSSGAVCLVLASDLYAEEEYFRRYEDFVRFKQGIS